MIDPAQVAFFIPGVILKRDPQKDTQLKLFNRISATIERAGGKTVRGNPEELDSMSKQGRTPVVGCSPELTDLIAQWRSLRRPYVYWDRGYFRRVYATWLPPGTIGGYYRFHINRYQLGRMLEVPDDRWKSANIQVKPWRKNGKHIVIAAPTRTYAKFHRTESWIADTIDALSRVTTRQLVIRDKESKRALQEDLEGAHALVTHGSIAAVESVILGTPVFVDPSSAAALVGLTDLKQIERPAYPDRQPWLNSLAYSQFSEDELTNGKLWGMLQ